jgi:hypothetical protein
MFRILHRFNKFFGKDLYAGLQQPFQKNIFSNMRLNLNPSSLSFACSESVTNWKYSRHTPVMKFFGKSTKGMHGLYVHAQPTFLK